MGELREFASQMAAWGLEAFDSYEHGIGDLRNFVHPIGKFNELVPDGTDPFLIWLVSRKGVAIVLTREIDAPPGKDSTAIGFCIALNPEPQDHSVYFYQIPVTCWSCEGTGRWPEGACFICDGRKINVLRYPDDDEVWDFENENPDFWQP